MQDPSVSTGSTFHGVRQGPAEANRSSLPSWPLPALFAFRFAFLFLLLAVFTTYDPLNVMPLAGYTLSHWIDAPISALTPWVAVHVFGVTGIAATSHSSDSRDTALGWTALSIVATAALAGAALWSVLDRRRREYRTAAAWMRYLLRMMLVFIMLRYAMFKIFPLQMPMASLAVLNEPLGQTSPWMLLWTLIGLHPGYEIVSGACEGLSAMLLFFRRTALLGALLGCVVMTNVVLFNFFFDVPVKLGAALILLALIAVAAPDVPALLRFLLTGSAAAPSSPARPAARSRTAARWIHAAEWAFLACVLWALVPASYASYQAVRRSMAHPTPFTGEWQVVSFAPAQKPVLAGDGTPATALSFEPDGRLTVRSANGRLWRAGDSINPQRHTLSLFSYYFDGTRFQAGYTYTAQGADRFLLQPLPGAGGETTLTLQRTPLPAHYPLLDTPFHWVQEWSYER